MIHSGLTLAILLPQTPMLCITGPDILFSWGHRCPLVDESKDISDQLGLKLPIQQRLLYCPQTCTTVYHMGNARQAAQNWLMISHTSQELRHWDIHAHNLMVLMQLGL